MNAIAWIAHPAVTTSAWFVLLYGALFHAWQGRTLSGLMWRVLVSLLGFAAGQALGVALGLPALGQTQALAGSWGALAALLLTLGRLSRT